MLKISNLEVTYMDVILVLRGISLVVNDGSVVTVLGANGAGKSTTLKAISGLLSTEEGKVSRGTIEFDGHCINEMNPEQTAKLGIIQVMEGRQLLEHLTVEENLRVGGSVYKRGRNIKADIDMVYGYFPKLKMLRNSTSGYLSGGEAQMLVMGRALMAHPKLLLLDEPSLGLSPMMAKEIYEVVAKINKSDKTAILLVEQNAMAALRLAEHGYVMENGRVVLDGPSNHLIENEDIKEFYLGLSQVGEKKSFRDIKHYKRRKRWLS